MKGQIMDSAFLEEYKSKQHYTLLKHIDKLRIANGETFLFAHTRSSVFSSMIEGSAIDLNNYLFNKQSDYSNREMLQIDDLIEAYQYAKSHTLSLSNILKSHTIAGKNFSIASGLKGKIRDKDVHIKTWTGETLYTGCAVNKIETELEKLFSDVAELKKQKALSYDEIFYYAAYAHLVFVNIHPFADGNGRIARLLEKWLLSELSRNTAVWKIPSEINYWIKREAYYKNLNRLGASYEELDYQESLPFLLMLPTSFGISKKFVN